VDSISVESDAWAEWLEAEAAEKFDVGEEPLHSHQRVRLIHSDFIHCSIHRPQASLSLTRVEGGGQSEEEEEGQCGSESGVGSSFVVLTHSLHNDPLTHMDSRHPPPPTASIRLPHSFAPSLLTLLSRSPAFIPIAELGPEALPLCSQLWRLTLLECRPGEEKPLGQSQKAKMKRGYGPQSDRGEASTVKRVRRQR